MKNINKIIKEKRIVKYILDDIKELDKLKFSDLIPKENIIDKSIEITYKNKDKILVIDYLVKLHSVQASKEE